MNEPAPHNATLPPSSLNGADPSTAPTPTAPTPTASTARGAGQPRRKPLGSRIGQVHVALIAGAVLLILVLIFIIENAHTVTITYFGAHLRVSLAVALLIAAIGGALIMAAAGTARITQLRLRVRRGQRRRHDG